MIKLILALSYPSVVCCMFCGVVFSFCNDHQLVDVSRGENSV